MNRETSAFDKHYKKSQRKYSELPTKLPENMPQLIKDVFITYGLSSFDDGFLWILDPLQMKEHYQPWFDTLATEEGFINPQETFPFMRTAFGDVFFFEENECGVINIITNGSNSISVEFFLNETLNNKRSLKYSYLHDLFEIALQRFGELESDECYAFLPPLALGGEIDEAHLQKVKLREHLALLADLLDD